jgi:hypothetical protein
MSYSTALTEFLQENLTTEEHTRVSTLIKQFAKSRAQERETEQKTLDANAITFGKHKGKTIQAVFAEEPTYVKWLATGSDLGKRNPRLLSTVLKLCYE